MNDLPNGKIAPSDVTQIISALEQQIKEREAEILNEPIPNEADFMETDDNEVEDVTDLDEVVSKLPQNGHVSLWGDSKNSDEEFARDSSEDNESVLSSEEETLSGETEDQAEDLKQKGDEKLRQCLWNEAIDFYTTALKLESLKRPLLHGNRSYCYMKIGEYEKAERDCCCAIELDPMYKRIYRRRSAIRLRRKDYFGSALDLQSFILLSHNTKMEANVMEEYKALLPLARLVKQEGANAPSVHKLEKAVLAQLSQIEETAAKSYRQRSMWSQAVESLTMAIVLSPGTPRLYYERAFANFKLGKTKFAEADCTEAIALEPSNHQHYRLRSDVRKKLGNVEGSTSDDRKATELRPTNEDSRTSRLEEPVQPVQSAPSVVVPEPPPCESSSFVRIPVQDVYSSSSEELFNLSKLPDKIRVCIFS